LSKLLVETRCRFFRNYTGIIVEISDRLRRNYFRSEGLRYNEDAKPHDKAPQPSCERTRLGRWFRRLAKTIFFALNRRESEPLLRARWSRALPRIRAAA
jgi:hypothetical protein